MTVDLDALCSRPEYLLNELNLDAAEAMFIELDPGALRRSAFMDQRLKSNLEPVARVPLLQLQNAIVGIQRCALSPPPVNYLLHSGFCCSTLISRCLDIEGACCSLREPWVLMQMANYRRVRNRYRIGEHEWRTLLDAVLFLLAKCHAPHEAILIKLPNIANNLSGELLAHPRTGSMLLLYSSLGQFLVSILKKGEAGRTFVRRLFNAIQMDSQQTRRLDPATLSGLTDLQIAALVWYTQMDAYLRLLARFPQAHIRTLDCDTFLEQPGKTLAKLVAFFGIHADGNTLEMIIHGPMFHKSSKDETQDYDVAIRRAEYADVLRQHGTDVTTILAWSKGIRPEGAIPLPLPAAL